mmetsp:Transcript_12526/g.20183  ORF Transcript_12526/g.20183 Transcript_12526/m.20183 type:complete len:124 (+) Transcript_12526:133-504(+)|eukprot:CAMPEP_0178735626 /NCGR_PEP_ID=MMETSP0744-20121128/1993_1 /TAXON_ID=913974 /ORGANISM="Nitzschia punctata, Strain CCMP561" /LENGTH=123 /DNA_ID=CAMNT_0020388017 /DNA_START=41 /DNA_END=412 /DNA_ORIENTATION=-
MSAEEIANAFVQHYYRTLDTGVDALAGLFSPQSMMTFEGQQHQGTESILAKLKSVGQVSHDIKSTDVQPSINSSAIVIFVTGIIKIGTDNPNPLHFCEVFQLVSSGGNNYFVNNVIFRLNYGI